METSLKIERDMGYAGNTDAQARRDRAISLMVMTVSTITIKALNGKIETTEDQEDDKQLSEFLSSDAPLFEKMEDGDRTAFHILEAGDDFVLRINVSKDKVPVYCIELMFGTKNESWSRHFTGWVVRRNVEPVESTE